MLDAQRCHGRGKASPRRKARRDLVASATTRRLGSRKADQRRSRRGKARGDEATTKARFITFCR